MSANLKDDLRDGKKSVFQRKSSQGHKHKALERFLGIFASAAAAFVTGLATVLGFPSYMCVAVAALSGNFIIPAFIGAALAFVLKGSFEGGIIQLCSILVIAALRAVNPLGEHRDEPMYMALMTAGSLMLFGCVMSAAVPSDVYTASMRMINSLLCGCVVFIARTIYVSRSRKGVYDLTGINGVFISIIYIMLISSLSSVSAFSFNAGRIFGVFILLQAVRKYRGLGGAVIGALTACGVLICEPELSRNTLLLAASGLICGAFIQFGTLLTVLVFLAASLLSLVAVGVNGDTYCMFADLVTGSALFIAVPVQVIKKFGKKISGFRSSLDIVGQTTSSRLALAGDTLGGIRHQLEMVTNAMDKRCAARSVADDVKRCVCNECSACDFCFGKSDMGGRAFFRFEQLCTVHGGIDPQQVRQELKCCAKPEAVAAAFTDLYARLVEEKSENIRMRELRGFLNEQLSSMEDILNDLSFRSSQVRNIDPALSAKLKDYFASVGSRGAKACVYVDENLCRRADVFVTSGFSGDIVRITAAVSSILDCDMGMPDVLSRDGLTRISFAELASYTVKTASFTASAGEEYSGDSFDVFDLNGSEKYILLSDGMGTGKRARLDSVFTVSLAKKLICSGISMSTAHRLINSMLRVKGWEESFATMDLMKIDLNGACAKLLKSGAVQSRLCRDGSVSRIGGQAYPAGILPDCIPNVTEIKLFDGDMIVMTSDGADDETADEIAMIAAENSGEDLEKLVRKMGETALCNSKNKDDLTIIAAIITAGCDE